MKEYKVDFLKDLNPQQYEAVVNIQGPLIILAGPGTGKTRVIAYKIVYLLQMGVPPENILAVTFTNKAAEEMCNRVMALCGNKGKEVNIFTFHSWGLRFLRNEIRYTNLRKNFTVYDESDQRQLIREVMKLCNIDERKYSIGYIADKINNAKDNLLDAESYFIHSMLSSNPEVRMLATIYKKYQEKLQEYNGVDFGDLILKPVEILRNNKEVLKKYRNKIEYMLVDEYQDTNHAQYVLTKYLVGKHRNISIVGDEDQAIYSWRGADFKNLWKFERDFPDAKIVKLEYNYRSIPEIIDIAQQLIKHNKLRKEKENKAVRTNDGGEGCVIYHQMPNERAEAEYVGYEIKSLVKGKKYKYSDIAVFYRLNAQSRILEDVFLLKEKIPYTIVGNISFYQRKEIKDILAYLKVIYNPKDSLSLKRIINTPARGIGKSSLSHVEKFMEENNLDLYTALLDVHKIPAMNYNVAEKIESFITWIQELHEKAPYMSLKKIVYNVLEYTKYIEELELEGTRDAKEKIRNIEELITKVSEFESSTNIRGKTVLESFLSHASLSTDIDLWEEDKRNSVTLMTLHLAKGLEFPVVFIVGLEEELFPLLSLEENIENEAALEELEEERRLCYVGVTRAKDRLYLTSAVRRNMFGVMVYRKPSRFIAEAGISMKQSFYKVKYSKDTHQQFHVGDRVRHPIFGVGTVVNCTNTGEDLRIIVEFEDGNWRKFVAKFAKLEKM